MNTADIEKQVQFWRVSAGEDLDTGELLVRNDRIRHGLFFAHLALEKMLKAHVTRATIEIVQRYLAKVVEAGIPVDRGIVFGSCARGEQRPDSDIDLLVVSSLFDRQKDHRTTGELWVIARHIDTRIEPIAVGVQEFEREAWRPLLMSARNEGMVVYAPRAADVKIAAEAPGTYTGSSKHKDSSV